MSPHPCFVTWATFSVRRIQTPTFLVLILLFSSKTRQSRLTGKGNTWHTNSLKVLFQRLRASNKSALL